MISENSSKSKRKQKTDFTKNKKKKGNLIYFEIKKLNDVSQKYEENK